MSIKAIEVSRVFTEKTERMFCDFQDCTQWASVGMPGATEDWVQVGCVKRSIDKPYADEIACRVAICPEHAREFFEYLHEGKIGTK